MKIKFLLLFVLFLMLSCTSLPKLSTGKNSAIAITLGTDVHLRLLTLKNIKPEKIYFVKLNSISDSLLKKSNIVSEYSFESRWMSSMSYGADNFLFNIEPGIYAAVAAYGKADDTTGAAKDLLILFPEKMIKSTILEIKSNTIVYAGNFFINKDTFMNKIIDADEIQKYYLNHLVKKQYGSELRVIAPSLMEIQQSKELEIQFLNVYSSKFKGTDWEGNIKNRLKALE
jgi:hypothetical protein